jgi:hypothetical protein
MTSSTTAPPGKELTPPSENLQFSAPRQYNAMMPSPKEF